MSKASVLVVDDHALFRDGMSALIDKWPEFHVVGQASDGIEAIRRARVLSPDLILMDVRMSPMGGVEATREISQQDPTVRVLMLTMSNLGEDVYNALRNGAHGYISKDEPADRLHEYLLAAMRGETALSSSLAARLLTDMVQPSARIRSLAKPRRAALTRRETEVLNLVVDGLSNGEIAESLHLSEATVKKHLGNVMTKFHMKNRVQVAVYSVREGIVSQA